MQITPASVNGMFTLFDVRFQKGYQMPEVWWSKLATLTPSGTEQNTYGWMDKLPAMRKWIGERQLQNLASFGYTLVNDDYEDTLELDRNKIMDDTYGLFAPAAEELGWAAAKWPDIMLAKVLTTGETTTCFDGQNFFDTAHPVSKYAQTTGTYGNYATSTALTYENYQTKRAVFLGVLGADGQPIGARPNLLVVPPQLEAIARTIVQADMIAPQTFGAVTNVGGFQNMMKGTAEVLVLPELASQATAWYLLDTSRPIKPFIFQQRKAPEFVFLNKPSDSNLFMRKKFIFGVDSRGAAGFTLPFLAAKYVG